MTHIKDIQYEWYNGSDYDIINQYLPLLPARTKYTLSMNKYDLKIIPDLDEKLRKLNWNDKRIYSISSMTLQQLNILI